MSSLVFPKNQSRFPPRISGSSKLHGKLRPRTGFFSERGSGHDRKPAFLVSSEAGNKVARRSSSQGSEPSAASLTGHQAPPQQQQSSLASGLSMLSIVIGHVRLREIFRRRGWSFPSSVAGMLGLLAGAISRVCTRATREGGGRKARETCSTRKCNGEPVDHFRGNSSTAS